MILLYRPLIGIVLNFKDQQSSSYMFSGLDINKDIHTNDDEPAVHGKADLQYIFSFIILTAHMGTHTIFILFPCARVKLEFHLKIRSIILHFHFTFSSL